MRTIFVGIVSSLAAAVVFLFLLSILRPDITISEVIAESQTADGRKVYEIKVLNNNDRPSINVRVAMHLVGPRVVPGGVIPEEPLRKLTIDNSTVFALGSTFRFRIKEDLDDIWQDDTNTFLRFTIIATDSLSGFSRVFTQKFHIKRNHIVKGDFEYGKSLTVR